MCLFYNSLLRKTSYLPNLVTGRSQHGCARVKRFGANTIVVFGGTGPAGGLSSVELYNLDAKASAWEIVPALKLPYVIGLIKGVAMTRYDEQGCDAVVISSYTQKIYKCSGKNNWTFVNFSPLMLQSETKFYAKVDGNWLSLMDG